MATDQTQSDGDRQSDLAVMDAQEYKQKRRLERLLDSVEGVQDTADDAWDRYIAGEITREGRNITIQRATKNAIRECHKLLIDHHREMGEEGDADRYWAGTGDDPVGTVDLLDESWVVTGLQDFLESPRFYETTTTQRVERRNLPDKTVSRTVEATMPEQVSYRAYLRLKEFLDDVHDMEISFEEMDDTLPTWGFEEVHRDDEDE